MKIRIFILLILTLFLSACLRTRSELGGTQKIHRVTEEQRKAQFEIRFQDIDGQMRHMHGRLEAVESVMRQRADTMAKSNQQKLESHQEIWARIKLLEQAIGKLEKKNQVQKKRPKTKSILAVAEGHFASQRWKEAALSFEQYRSKNPKGRQYVSATYKIGVSFEELGEKNNARLFYKEVIDNHPKHSVAKKARYRLKNLK